MKPSAPTAARQPWADWLLVAIFAAVLWLPTLDTVTGLDVTRPPDENRLLAVPPQLTRRDSVGVRAYATAAELYFNDHFGCRKRLLRWFQEWKARIFHDHVTATKGALIGQHGWLFFGDHGMIEHYVGLVKFSRSDLRTWQKVLEKRRDWLAARGCKYYFVIPPDKQYIYPEELPDWLQAAAPANRQTMLDQFTAYLREHSTVPVLDLRQPLLAAKSIAPTYLQNDTHWNAIGAFVGCQEIIKVLSRDFPDLPPLRREAFDWTNKPEAGGDLALMLGLAAPENNYFEYRARPPFSVPSVRPVTNIVTHYRDLQDANFSVLAESAAPRRETAVVFHDSFFGPTTRPIFSASFKQTLFVFESREFNTNVISQYHPQIVVTEMLERVFETQDPGELLAKDALP